MEEQIIGNEFSRRLCIMYRGWYRVFVWLPWEHAKTNVCFLLIWGSVWLSIWQVTFLTIATSRLLACFSHDLIVPHVRVWFYGSLHLVQQLSVTFDRNKWISLQRSILQLWVCSAEGPIPNRLYNRMVAYEKTMVCGINKFLLDSCRPDGRRALTSCKSVQIDTLSWCIITYWQRICFYE